jgi:hypothetical protein
LPLQRYERCSAEIKDGKFFKDFKKLRLCHPNDFAVRQKLAEIFIVQCDFTGKMTQPSSVTNFQALQDCQNPHWHARQCVKKYKDFDFRNGMTGKGCVCQKCSNHIYRKSCDFLAEHAGKISSISPFYQSKRRALSQKQRITFCPSFW